MGKLKTFIVQQAERWGRVRIVRPDMLYALPEQEHLKRFFSHFEVDCVFDVGANSGQYAQMLRTKVLYNGPIVSYEPIPTLAQSLRLQAKHDRKWYIEEIALDSAERDVSFHVMEFSQFSSLHCPSTAESTRFTNKNKVSNVISVRTSTLQKEIAKYSALLGFKNPFLKMDTQGHDLAVALGAGSDLREFIGIQGEIAIKCLYEGAPDYREALDFYAKHGFDLSAFVPNNEGHFPELIETDCILFRKN